MWPFSQINALRREKASLQASLSAHQDSLAEMVRRNGNLVKDLSATSQRLVDKDKALREARRENVTKAAALSEAEALLDSKTPVIEHLQAQLAEAVKNDSPKDKATGRFVKKAAKA